MTRSSVPDADHERARLAALRRYDILDTGAEREFDELVQRAARECGFPTALLSLMDDGRCWFKAKTGLKPADQQICELPREQTFCNYAFRSSGIFVVADARADERFRHLLVVDRPDGYRAYVGAQLITPDGHSIGTLCLLDDKPRDPTPEELATLRRFAIDAMALLESRRTRDDAPAPPVTVLTMPAVERRTVLVAEDEVVVLRFIVHLLQHRGYTVLEAEDGAQALAKYRERAAEIGVVITDINMPELDGFGLIRALRAERHPPEFVVMSGRLDAKMRLELQELGITRVLAKPFLIAEFDRVLATLKM